MGVGRGASHKELNNRTGTALAETRCVSVRKPAGFTRTDGKQPDGVTVLLLKRGMPITWDMTVIHTCAQSDLSVSVNADGAVAAAAESKTKLEVRSYQRSRSF